MKERTLAFLAAPGHYRSMSWARYGWRKIPVAPPPSLPLFTRNTEGEVLSYSQLENGHRVSTWVATGDKTSVQMGDEDTLASWVLNVWQTGTRLLDTGYDFVGTGRWYGQPTAIYEDTRTISINISNFTAAQREAMGVSPDQTTVKEVFVGQLRARGGQVVTLPERHMVHGRGRSSNADRRFQNSGIPAPARRHLDWPVRQIAAGAQVAPRFNESHGLSSGRAHRSSHSYGRRPLHNSGVSPRRGYLLRHSRVERTFA